MTVPGNLSSPLLATATGAAAAAEYVIPKSLRFNSGDSAYLSRTPSVAGNTRTWTWSGWVKRTNIGGVYPRMFGTYTGGSYIGWDIEFNNNDKIDIHYYDGSSYVFRRTTTAVYRDPSAWYHIVVAVDTTQATANNRIKLYVNGVQVTAFDTNTNASQDYSTNINTAVEHRIGRNYSNSDFYLADIQFVDGVALAPTDFGETRSSDGVWVPKEFTGFGANPNDGTTWSSSLTTNAGDNFDSSGAKTKAFDGSTSTKAYTANNSDGTTQNTSYIQLNSPKAFTGNLKVICDNGNAVYDVTGGGSTLLATNSTGSDGALIDCGTVTSADKIRVLMAGGSRPAIAAIYIDGNALLDDAVDNSFHLNFGDSSTIEALGFDSAPTIPDLDPKKGMDVITYSGNGGTQNIGGLNFEPGLVWIKQRNESRYHAWYDSVRGADQLIRSSGTNAEVDAAGTGLITFNPDGFTVSTDNGANKSSGTYVAWTWRAGGPAVSNTDGTITSQVSANTDYGFSIVKWTATNDYGTIGHGLTNQTPKFIIVKSLASANWAVFHTSLGNTKGLNLNLNGTGTTDQEMWNNTSPTTSLFSVGSFTNYQTADHIAYVWSEVSGFSKFGTYEGASTVTVTTGFRPRWILLKNVDTSGSWSIFDSERDSDLEINHRIYANESSAEGTNTVIGNFTDTGFTLTNQGNSNWNTTGDTFVYAAFASRPGNNWDVNNIVTNEGLTTSKTQFDVLTYTGNGGAQKLGGPVFSSSADSGLTHADGVTGMFDGSLSTRGGAPSTDNSYKTLTDGASISASTGIRIYWNGVGAGQRYIRINGTTELDDGSAALTPGWSTQSSFSGTINKIEVKTAATGSWSLAAVEVDGTILIDGTGPGLLFQPDLVWIKRRDDSAKDHNLYDVVRGASGGYYKQLVPNVTSVENNNSSDYGRVTALNSDGFTVDSATSDHSLVNDNGDSYVAWCWKAGGTAVSNTEGDVTASVSANAAYGFSIVKWTSTSTSGTESVGHGLGKRPAMVIFKERDRSSDWYVWHQSVCDADTKFFKLNENVALQSGAGDVWGDLPTESLISINNGSINATGSDNIAYCFADIPGYQRFGTYYSNSSDPVVITGFKPRFLLTKKTSSGAWTLHDSQRDFDDDDNRTTIEVNSSSVEEEHANKQVKFLDNGFQLIGADMDTSATDWIYWAIGDDEIGSDEDCLVDVPNAVTADADATDTTGGYQRGNYATLNPLDNGGVDLSNGNLDVSNGAAHEAVRSTIKLPSSGKWYAEATHLTNNGGSNFSFGVDTSGASTPAAWNDSGKIYISTSSSGRRFKQDTTESTIDTTSRTGDVLQVAYDADNEKLYLGINGTWYNSSLGTDGDPSAGSNPTRTSVANGFLSVNVYNATGSFNAGQMRFKYPIPSGYAALNTTALPAATIEDASAYFDAKLHTGNGSTQTISNFQFSPSFVWVKQRNTSRDHRLANIISGTGKDLRANATDAEVTDANGITAFNSDGFSVGSSTGWNQSSGTYVSFAWDAGSSTVSNTDGSITSSVRASATSGFSIVSWSGTGANATVGHSLNAQPGLVLVKNRDASASWAVWHTALTGSQFLGLNTSNAIQSSANYWNSTAPTSSVFSVGSDSSANGSSNDMIAYCIAPVAGFSAVGSYEGTGSAGNFVHTGFRVAWLLLKNADGTNNWQIMDTTREPINQNNVWLQPNTGTAEQDNSAIGIDFLSNGFCLRGTDGGVNGSGNTYVYYAVAENPFSANGGLAR